MYVIGVNYEPFEALPSYSEGMPKKEQERIAHRPKTVGDQVEAFVHSKNFPIVCVVIIGLWLLSRR